MYIYFGGFVMIGKRIIAVLLAALMVFSVCVLFSGCGCDDSKKTSKSSQSSKQTSKSLSKTESDTQAQEETSETIENDVDESDGYIDEATALAKVKEQAGSGATIDGYYKGYAPDGAKAWVITVIPVTTADGPDSVVYYVNEGFCYTQNSSGSDTDDSGDSSSSGDSDDSDGYISEAQALANVREQAGSGAQIKSSQKGYSPDGAKAWVITVIPITKADGSSTVTYYTNEGFCYTG